MGRGALNGSILFILTIQKLLNIEQIYKTSQQNHRYIYIYIYKRKLQQILGTIGKLLMSGISWG
jgi:predicted nucleotidyltransferase